MKKLLSSIAIIILVLINSASLLAGGGGGGGTPSATSLSCGNTVTFNLDANGFSGANPTGGDNGCNPCCYAGADLDGDGSQDVPFSVENSEWYQYCNSSASPVTVSFNADEIGSGSTCNIQGAVWVGTALNSTTLDCGNPEYAYFDSNVGGAADGFTFSNITIPAGQCAFFMIDGYTGATCSAVSITVTCPCTTPVASASPQTICSGSATSVALSSTVAGTTYTWTVSQSGVSGGSSGSGSTIAQTLTATGTSAGTAVYTVTPTAGGCVGTPITVTVTVNPKPVMTSASSATICSGGTVSIPLTSSPTGSTYTWIAANNANTSGESTTTQTTSTLSNTITNSSTSVQVVTYTVTPTLAGCVGTTQTVAVTVNPVPTMTSAATATVCSGTAVNLTFTSNVASTYSWIAANNANTTGESTTAQTGGVLNNTIVNSTTSAQVVTYTVTPTSSAGSCLGITQTVAVTVNPAPVMTSASSATICSGGTVSIPLTSNIASTYTWIAANNANTTGESTTTQSASTLSNTITNSTSSAQVVTYTVTPTSTAGSCVGTTQTVAVTVNPAPTMTSASTATICSGATVSIPLTSDNTSTYTWIAANNANTSGESTTLQSTATLSNTITNSTTSVQVVTYTVTPTSSPQGCLGNTQTVAVSVNPVPAMTSASTATICSGATVSIPLTSNVASTYTWIAANNGNTTGESTTLQSTATLSNTITNTSAVAQIVSYTVTPTSVSGSCLGTTQTVAVTVNPAPTMTSASSAAICSGGTVSIPLTSNIASSYTWSAADNANTTGESTTLQSTSTLSNTIVNTSAIAQSVIYTVTPTSTVGSCAGTPQTVTVTVNPPDNASFSYSSSTYCQTGTNPTPTVTGLAGGTFSSTAGLAFVSTATGQINLSGSTLGSYTITYTTNGACPNTGTFNITITTSPSAAFSYAGPYCQSDADPNPVFGPGASAGIFSAPAGVVFISTSTGQIDLSASTPGTYTIKDSIPAAGGCGAASSTNTITINAVATADAGANQTVCAASPAVTLAGSVGGSASTGTWSGGTGTFNPDNTTLNAVYTPSATEIGNGTVTLTLTTNDPAGPCSAVTDQMIITINSPATANAGTPLISCASSPAVTLAGSVGGSAVSGTWSGGGGTFNPDNTTLNAVYTPSAGEISTGTVTLTLTTNDPAGPCPAATSTVLITINPVATAEAGPAQTSCASSPAVTLAGSVGGSASTGTWSGGTGTFNPDNTTLTAVYTPSAAEITAGSVILTLTTNDPAGPCAAATDQVTIFIDQPATANAGGNQTVCSSSPDVTLAGTIGGTATSGTWSGGTGTFNPDNTTLNAVYTPSATEIANSTVTLTLTTDDPSGPCPAATSQMTITIDAPATSDAGPAQSVCSSSATVTLAGSVGGSATSGTWSGGAGTFNPDNTTLNATYTPTPGEISSGGVLLTLTTNDPAGPCPAATSQMAIAIDPDATVDAGPPQTICASSSVTLAGTVGGSAFSGTWSGGAGTFIPDNTSLNAVYTPSAQEAAAGSVTLTLTTNDPAGPCGPQTDQVLITITPPDDASFNYSSATYCVTGTDPSPVITGLAGGTFSSTAGLSIDPSTGLISLSGSTLGVYTITYATNGTCPNSGAFNVTLTNSPSAEFNYSGPYCQSGSNPVPAFGPGASPGVFTSITPGLVFVGGSPGEIDLLASTPGTYSVINTIAAGGGCATAADTASVTIDQPVSVSAGSSASICAGSTYTLSGAFGGSATGITWTSSGSGTFNDSSLVAAVYNPSAADIAAGNVTLTISTDDPSGACSAATGNIVLTLNPSDDASFNFGGASTFCQTGGNQVPVVVMPGVFSALPAGLVFVSTSTGEIDIAGSTLGTYAITHITSGTCPDTSTFNVTITLSPSAAFSYSGPYCQGAGGTAMPVFNAGSSGGTFSSSGGLGLDPFSGQINIGSSTNGTYTVYNSISASGGCAAALDSTTVVIDQPATANAGVDTAICSGTSYLTAGNIGGSATTLLWTSNGSGSFINASSGASTYTPSAADSTAGSVILTITTDDPAGACAAVSDAFVLTINPLPSLSAGLDQSLGCGAGTAILSGSSPSSGASFSWTGPGIVSGGNTNSITVNATGTYTLTVVSSSGCVNIDSAVVNSNINAPNISMGTAPLLTCAIVSDTVTGSSSTLNASFSWSGPGVISGGTNDTAVIGTAGTYTLTVTDPANGCISIDSVIVSSNTTAPFVSMGAAPTLTCTVTSDTVTASSSALNSTFSWSGPGIISGAANDSAVVNTAGTYTVVVTNPANGCSSTNTVLVGSNTTPPLADAGPSQAIGCGISSATLDGSASATGATISYNWSTAAGNISSGGTTVFPVVTLSGIYTITVTDGSNGCSATDNVTVVAAPSPTASFSANPSSGLHPLPVSFTNTSQNSNTYIWNFGDGNTSVVASPSEIYTTAGTYIVTLIVSNNSQCPDTAQSTIVVFDDFSMIIPNIFTPGGDNVNDEFIITSKGVEAFNAVIYDRWGLKLFEWNDVATGWNGRTSNGNEVPDGTYYYLITAKGLDGVEHFYKGYVQLLR